MNEETKQAAIDAINTNEFLFLIAGTQNEDGSYDTQRVIDGEISELAFPIAEALKENPSLEKCVVKIRLQEEIPEILHELADAFAQDLGKKNSKQDKENGETENE